MIGMFVKKVVNLLNENDQVDTQQNTQQNIDNINETIEQELDNQNYTTEDRVNEELAHAQANILVPFIPPQVGINTNAFLFSAFVIPKDRAGKIKRAKDYRHIDLVNRMLRIKTDFSAKITDVECKNKKQKEWYQKNVLPLVKRIYPEWVFERNTLGDVFLHFGYKNDDRTPMFLIIEDPLNVEVTNALNAEIYKVKVSQDFKKNVEVLRKNKELNKLPKYIRDAVESNDFKGRTLTLTSENMYRTSNLKQDYEVYSEPPLIGIAEAIELHRVLTDADYASAYMMKNQIMHVQVGDPKDPKSMSKERVDLWSNIINQQPPGSQRITTPADVKISYVNPSVDVFKEDKYQHSWYRILNHFGITETLINGISRGYAGALVGTKGLAQSCIVDQGEFNDFFKHYSEGINSRNNFKEEVTLVYDRSVLQDHTEMVAEIKLLTGLGIMRFVDVCKKFGYDVDEQLIKAKWDREHVPDIWPVWESAQGLLQSEFFDSKTSESNDKSNKDNKNNNKKQDLTNPKSPGSY